VEDLHAVQQVRLDRDVRSTVLNFWAVAFSSVSADSLKNGFTFTNRCWCGGAQVIRLEA